MKNLKFRTILLVCRLFKASYRSDSDVIKAIKGQESTYVTGEEARAAFELVQAIYKSATTRSEVSLPLMYSDDFYRKDTMVPLMPVFNIKTGNVKGFTTSTIKVGGSEYIEEK